MKLSIFILLLLCLGCSKKSYQIESYQIDKNVKIESLSLDASQFANESGIIRSVMKLKNDSTNVIVLNNKDRTVNAIEIKKDSVQKQ